MSEHIEIEHVPESAVDEILRLRTLVRKLREAWFVEHVKFHSHEREWETEEAESRRERNSVEMKEKFDAQTELIIAGGVMGPLCYLFPRCAADLDRC